MKRATKIEATVLEEIENADLAKFFQPPTKVDFTTTRGRTSNKRIKGVSHPLEN